MDRQPLLPLMLSAMLATALHGAALSLPRPAQTDIAHQPVTPAPQPEREKPAEDSLKPVPEKPQPPELQKPAEPETKPEPKPEPTPEPEPETPTPAPPELSQEALSEPEPLQMEIGREDAPRIATIAWISHDDFRELMAMQSRTIQPGLQREVVAQADAPLNFEPAQPREQFGMPELARGAATPDPGQSDSLPQPAPAPAAPLATTPPTPPAEPAPQPEPSAPETPNAVPATEPTPAKPEQPPAVREDAPGGKPAPEPANEPDAVNDPPREQLALGPMVEPRPSVTPSAEPTPSSESTAASSDTTRPADSPAATQPAGEKPRQGDQGQTDKTAGQATQTSPTSVTQSDRESLPTQLDPATGPIQLGRVVASQGIEIKTVRPRFSIATLYTATPRNPRVRVVFDRQGQVLLAEIIRSSGYADIDGPILNALYAWRASGKMLQEMKSSTFEWRGSILLVDEPDTP